MKCSVNSHCLMCLARVGGRGGVDIEVLPGLTFGWQCKSGTNCLVTDSRMSCLVAPNWFPPPLRRLENTPNEGNLSWCHLMVFRCVP